MNRKIDMEIKRGMVFYANIPTREGSVQSGRRPVVIVQNDIGNKFSPCVQVCVITSKIGKHKIPTQVFLNQESNNFLTSDSLVLAEQTTTLDKFLLASYLGNLSEEDILKVDEALKVSLALTNIETREVKIAKDKAEYIRGIDSLIQIWLSKGRDIALIEEDMQEREMRIKDMDRYCKRFGLDYNNYYKPVTLTGGVEKNNFKRVS